MYIQKHVYISFDRYCMNAHESAVSQRSLGREAVPELCLIAFSRAPQPSEGLLPFVEAVVAGRPL